MSQPTFNEEQVRDYCHHRPLSRPTIEWTKTALVIVACVILVSLCAYVSQKWIGSFLLNLDILTFSLVMMRGKSILRFIVQVYQHYASEQRRRMCKCMPSCSEYALLALDKYLWPKALWLITRRLMKTCPSPGYKIDYP